MSLFVLKRGRMPLVNMAAPTRYQICVSRARARSPQFKIVHVTWIAW